jgi:hypothetical protein
LLPFFGRLARRSYEIQIITVLACKSSILICNSQPFFCMLTPMLWILNKGGRHSSDLGYSYRIPARERHNSARVHHDLGGATCFWLGSVADDLAVFVDPVRVG